MKLYVCGPMTGVPDKNFPAFRTAAEQLRQAGYEVVDPSTLGEHDNWAWADYLKRDLPEMLKCDGLALLPGWEHSRGAGLEYLVARGLGMRHHGVPEWVERAGPASRWF